MLTSYLLGEVHLLGVKLVQLVLGAPSCVLLLIDLEVGYLGLLHHMLKKHLLVQMTCYVGFVWNVCFFLSRTARLENLVSSSVQTLHQLSRLSALITKQDQLIDVLSCQVGLYGVA